MERLALPLTRKLTLLEALDAGVWFVRDRLGRWLQLACPIGFAFALLLAAFHELCGHVAPDVPLRWHFLRVALFAALLAAVLLLRGIGQWGALEMFRAHTLGGPDSLAGFFFAALRRLPAAIFLCGLPGACAAGGLCLGFYPGLAAVNAWSLAMPAAVFEKLDSVSALRRSRSLMEGSFAGAGIWVVLAAGWLLTFLNLLILGAMAPDLLRMLLGFDVPVLSLWASPRNPVYLLLSVGVSYALIDAIRVAAFAALYLNARIEREGNDLLFRLNSLRAGRERTVDRVAG